MYVYETVSEAISSLNSRGFEHDFGIDAHAITCSNSRVYSAEDLEIVEWYRFEGDTDPADEAIVLGLAASDSTKGTLVVNYGPNMEQANAAFLEKISLHLSK
ncbi:MAG: hypothetical protein K2P88_12750 [Chitinophagaceae bacterium]|nr:hypothetical protein [Chitinophagaceae bacterium]